MLIIFSPIISIAKVINIPTDAPTINAAVNAASSGDTVIIDPGTYYENVDFKGKYLTIVGKNGAENTIIDGGGADAFIVGGVGNSEFRGLSIINSNNAIAHDLGGNFIVKIVGCYLHNNNVGVLGRGHFGINILNSLITKNKMGYLQSYYGIDSSIINSTFADNDEDISYSPGYSTKSKLEIVNSILRDKVRGWEDNFVYLRYCNYDPTKLGANVVLHNGNQTGDPLFVDAVNGNYHLQSASPSIDAGDPSYDFSKEPFPNGNRINMGRYGNTSDAEITVRPGNHAPQISGIPSHLIFENCSYRFTPVTIDNDLDDKLVFSIINKPTWATFDTLTGSLTGTPASIDSGTTEGIIINVTDGIERATLPAFDLSVVHFPVGTIKINNGDTYTNSGDVVINLSSIEDLQQVQFSNDGTNWSAPEDYAATKSWTLSSGDGAKTVYVKFKDGVGNWSNAYTVTVTLDTTAPAVGIGSPSTTTTKSGPVTYTVTYTGADAVTLADANVTLINTGTANGTIAVSGTGNTTRTVTISSITGDGTLGISIASGTASDSAGNLAAASGPSSTFTVDNTTNGSMIINAQPDAMNAIAPWTLTGPNSYGQSGMGDQTLSILPIGDYTITWGAVSGWDKPSPTSETKAVTDGGTTTFAGTYIQQLGSLTVTISPQGAVTAGAQWKRVGTATWLNSGSTESSIPVGSYTVEFKPVTGWTTPSSAEVTISNGVTATVGRMYVQQMIPVIQVTQSVLNFGYVPPGSSKDLILVVKNIGGGILTGTVTACPPFSIVSGADYSLVAGESQQVIVRYTAPLQEGSQTCSFVFTGGGGLTVQVKGSNKKVGLPWLLLLLGD